MLEAVATVRTAGGREYCQRGRQAGPRGETLSDEGSAGIPRERRLPSLLGFNFQALHLRDLLRGERHIRTELGRAAEARRWGFPIPIFAAVGHAVAVGSRPTLAIFAR
jgi:hypothetical protein